MQPNHLGTHQLRDVGGVELDVRTMDVQRDRFGGRRIVLRLVDLAGLLHAPQHVRPALGGALDAGDRIVARRRARQAGDQRGLGQRQVADLLVEVHLRRGPDAVGALAEKDPVEVQGEDLLLGEAALDAQRREHLLQLAPHGPLGGEHRIASELHRDGPTALAHAAGGHVARHGAQQSLPVDPRVLEEPVVFRREERVDDHLGNLLVGHRDAALLADLRDQLAVARVHRQGQLAAHVAQGLRVRKLGLEKLVGAGEPQRQEHGQRERQRGRRQQPAE